MKNRVGVRQSNPDGVKLVIELTRLCNFSCIHCLREESPRIPTRRGGGEFLAIELIDRVLKEVEPYGMVDHVALTGGEPTIHPRFGEIVALIAESGCALSLVTNGWNFSRALAALIPVRSCVRAVSFSLDGATEATHDAIRRREGSFRQVIDAIMQCRHRQLAAQINMTVTRANSGELVEMALLASRMGCNAIGYAHCQPTPDALAAGLVMGMQERMQVEADIADIQQQFQLGVYLAGDHYSDSLFVQCSQLGMREFNIDARGYLTACCALSNYRGGAADTDVVADLNQVSFPEAHQALIDRIAAVNREKVERLRTGEVTAADHFMCSHCLKHYRKVPDLEAILLESRRNHGKE